MTLTQAASLTKRTITSFAIVLFVGIVGFVGYKIWYANYLRNLPPVEIKPDAKFAMLPSIDFPKTDVSSSNFSYSIDTVTGSLPKLGIDKGFDKIIKVYFVTKPFSSLLSSQKSQTLAKKFNIQQDPQIISETVYSFQDQDKNLTVNIDSGNFTYVNNATPSSSLTVDPADKLVSDFKGQLSALIDNSDAFATGRSKIVYLQNTPQGLVPTDQAANAQFVQISLWPNDINGTLIYTPEYNRSLINATVSTSASSLDNYLSLNYTSWPIDLTTFATYPAKTVDAALEDLKTGKGVIEIQPTTAQASITNVTFGYYLSTNYHSYLQPIYIFSGPQFAAYVSAVTDQYINSQI